MSASEQIPVLDFMVVRPPRAFDAGQDRRYIHDTVLAKGSGHQPVDLQSSGSPSAVGRAVHDAVLGTDHEADDPVLNLRQTLLAMVDSRPEDQVDLHELERRAHLRVGTTIYLLPDTPQAADVPLGRVLPALREVLAESAAQVVDASDAAAVRAWHRRLLRRVGEVLGTPARDVVFSHSAYAEAFESARRRLFDALYLLYVMRRWVSVNVEAIMVGLQCLHALEQVAIDDLYAQCRRTRDTRVYGGTLAALAPEYPGLGHWDGSAALPGFPTVTAPADLAELLAARPVIHPIFARLFHYTRPFNDITPLGVGDLKVVRQQLIGYEPGEISDIHNVMAGESYTRRHRRLEKTEQTYTSTSTSTSESTRDTASTDRFEVKREAEDVVKTDLNVSANLKAQYDNKVVLVAASAGFAYTRDTSEQQKVAQNFAREVVDKAVSRIQTTASTTRTVSAIFETEEHNTHRFAADPARGHESGIYRWVDKRYRAQVYDYGKRLMFEFIVPEPAALLVEARLRAYEATIDVPRRPKAPVAETVNLGFGPSDITESRFRELRQHYALDDVEYPPEALQVQIAGSAGSFAAKDLDTDNSWHYVTDTWRSGLAGYQLETIMVGGEIHWFDSSASSNPDRNMLAVYLDGTRVWTDEYQLTDTGFGAASGKAVSPPLRLLHDDVTVTVGVQDARRFDLLLTAIVRRTDDHLHDWQTSVWRAVHDIEDKAVQQRNAAAQAAYENALATFKNRLDQIRTTAIHDLIQGQSEAYNKDLVVTELRRHCLAMLTKDFDADAGDDLLTDWETMGTRSVGVTYRNIAVDDTVDPVRVAWEPTTYEIGYPLPDVAKAPAKGRYIQFLEQAFDWGRLGYVAYPYFWATPPKWLDLMSRADDADPTFTAFLRAGAVRVLVSATPGYDDAVLHFLATREPWEGGPAPVIGDPLYLPIFEELHRQQDDRFGGVPDGDPWEFTLPTSLVYLEGSATPLPSFGDEPPAP